MVTFKAITHWVGDLSSTKLLMVMPDGMGSYFDPFKVFMTDSGMIITVAL